MNQTEKTHMRRHMTMGPSMKHGQLPMPNRILRLQATVPGIPVPEFVLASSKKKKSLQGIRYLQPYLRHQTYPSSIQCLVSSSSYVGWPLQPCTAPHCQPPTFWRRAGGRERSRDASRSWGSRVKNGWEIGVPTWPGISGRILGWMHMCGWNCWRSAPVGRFGWKQPAAVQANREQS